MSDPTNDRDDRDLDAAAFDDPAFDEVRELLAEARVTDPIPADVAARLDVTLASLHAERRAERVGATVVPLRRRLGPLLAAAAVVVVVAAGGVGIAQVARNGSGSDSGSSDSAASSADAGSRGPTAPEAGTDTSAPDDKGLATLETVPRFTTARFAQQAARYTTANRYDLNGTTPRNAPDSASPTPTPTTASPTPGSPVAPTDGLASAAKACSGPVIPDTQAVPILLDGVPAVLVVHPVTDGTQLLEAWSCDGSSVLTSATVTR